MATCKGSFECMLRLLNFFLTLAGLAMVGYGIYLLVEWMKISGDDGRESPVEVLVFGQPLLTAVALLVGLSEDERCERLHRMPKRVAKAFPTTPEVSLLGHRWETWSARNELEKKPIKMVCSHVSCIVLYT
ncbi:uncharacterized protein LOC133903333 [Phragmites australis]|uniref:uncharacterized protein LOC133903333 n=1 Tax=Phragmites australis TaxID=29695 RepID=UPI002D7958BD|nr:uncharacterized protein LOC133903333 [Phragmites australis]